VLRRFVMTVAQPAEARTVPGLIGSRWLAYLDARWSEDAFRHGIGRKLLDAPYAPEDSVDRDEARELARVCFTWVKSQRPKGFA
jgi:hypothetical protein